jgi:PAS domain S-box-containing protein
MKSPSIPENEWIHEIERLRDRIGNLQAVEKECALRTTELAESQKRLMREIDKHRRMERALRRSEQKFRRLFYSAPISYLSLRLTDGHIFKSNAAAQKLLGLTANELFDARLSNLFADSAEMESLLVRLQKGETIRNVQSAVRRNDGTLLWVDITAEPIQNPKGRLNQCRLMLVDVSERKSAEEKLKAGYQELEKKVAQRTAELQQLKDRLQEENTFLREELADLHAYGDIVGESLPIQNVIRQIELVAPTDASTLILGESGTGKELVAREIHRHSNRKNHPMIKVNCAVIPRELYESEFFGHAKGSFTGAVRDRIGRFAAADGGTLFLDEVAEIPPELQGKLLRVLQEGEYERIGEEKTRKVDVRIIAATNQDLREKVNKKLFREDLYYRLNVFPIEVPPLRAHKEDVRPLAEYFLNQAARRLNRAPAKMTLANLRRLQAYDWPGNVRELQNVIERAVILSTSGSLRLELPAQVAFEGTKESLEKSTLNQEAKKVLSEAELKALQRENMLAALQHCRWKIYGRGGAAELLQIKPTTLIERMKRFNVIKPREIRQPSSR